MLQGQNVVPTTELFCKNRDVTYEKLLLQNVSYVSYELTLSDFVLSYLPPIGFAAAKMDVLAFSEA